jgi:hypothetical protein
MKNKINKWFFLQVKNIFVKIFNKILQIIWMIKIKRKN